MRKIATEFECAAVSAVGIVAIDRANRDDPRTIGPSRFEPRTNRIGEIVFSREKHDSGRGKVECGRGKVRVIAFHTPPSPFRLCPWPRRAGGNSRRHVERDEAFSESRVAGEERHFPDGHAPWPQPIDFGDRHIGQAHAVGRHARGRRLSRVLGIGDADQLGVDIGQRFLRQRPTESR